MGEGFPGHCKTPGSVQNAPGSAAQLHAVANGLHPSVIDDGSLFGTPGITSRRGQVLACHLVVPRGIRHCLEESLDNPGCGHTLLGRFRGDLHAASLRGCAHLRHRPRGWDISAGPESQRHDCCDQPGQHVAEAHRRSFRASRSIGMMGSGELFRVFSELRGRVRRNCAPLPGRPHAESQP